MVSDYWLAVLIGLLIGSSITAAGMYMLGFRRVHRGGRTLLVPEIDRRPARVRWREFRARFPSFELRPPTFVVIVGLMVAAVAAGLVQNTTFTYQQRQCNDEFRRTIIERADIGADDNVARKAQDQAVADLISRFLTIDPGPNARDESRAALEQYIEQFNANNARHADNERKRAANPYPQC